MIDRALLCGLATVQPASEVIHLPPGLGDLSAKAFVGLVVIMVLTGRLVPGRERDYWRRAFFEAQQQKGTLLETAEVTQGVLQSLPDVTGGERDQ